MSTTEWQIITQIWSSYSSCCMCSNSRQMMSKQWLPCRSATAVAPPAQQWHLTGPAVLPPTRQSCRQWSPWHRHQTAVVTQWDRHVRSDTAVVPLWFRPGSAVAPRRKTHVWRVGENYEKLLAVSLRWWRFWPKTVVAPRLQCDGGIRYNPNSRAHAHSIRIHMHTVYMYIMQYTVPCMYPQYMYIAH